MATKLQESLAQILIASGCTELEEAATLAEKKDPGVSWTNTILNSGKVDETKFLSNLAQFFRFPFEEKIVGARLDRNIMNLFPSRFVVAHQIVPLRLDPDGKLVLATFDPLNKAGQQLAASLAKGHTIKFVVVPRAAIWRSIKATYGVGAETFDEILKSRSDLDEALEQEVAMDLNADDPEASVVKFVNQIIREAIAERATDIHVEPQENDLRIRYRIDGMLHEVAVPPQLRLLQSAIISRLKVMARMDIAEKRLPQDGRINLTAGATVIDVRVSTIPTVNGESISLRLLSRDDQQEFQLDRLDLTEKQTAIVHSLLKKPNGIILITGPTGSGKSTSLYCFLSTINSVERRIITIEEPVEYRLPGVSQIDVRSEIGLTFANGLRAILRQDPNVVMVGEIRDQETADIAIRSAMTGHLVFSTLHTNDAVGGITRLIDMDIEPFLLASTVQAFLAQRLVRVVCPYCKEKKEYLPSYLREIGFPVEYGTQFWYGKGCDHCRHTGYQGRVVIYEICIITEAIKRLIVQKANGSELKAVATRDGMLTLRQDGWRRVLAGQTSIEEVVRVTQEDQPEDGTKKRHHHTTETAEPV